MLARMGKPGNHRLPPLNALRAFEVAARHLSLTRAARELNVTQAAVSYQVKLLEDRLGVRLFQRHGGGLTMTSEAAGYLPAVREAFEILATATEHVTKSSPAHALSVSTYPHFAMTWLLPHLHSFNRKHPDINLTVETSVRSLEFNRNRMDVAVRWGDEWAGLCAHYLFSADLVPLCSPRLMQGSGKLRRFEELRNHRLLHVENGFEDWELWLAAAGMEPSRFTEGLSFESLAFALQAAVDGLGVVMGRLPLAQEFISSGKLVAPFRLRYRTRKAYYLLYPKSFEHVHKVRLFREWVESEVRTCEHHVASEAERLRRVGPFNA